MVAVILTSQFPFPIRELHLTTFRQWSHLFPVCFFNVLIKWYACFFVTKSGTHGWIRTNVFGSKAQRPIVRRHVYINSPTGELAGLFAAGILVLPPHYTKRAPEVTEGLIRLLEGTNLENSCRIPLYPKIRWSSIHGGVAPPLITMN